jgi:hypothetical protein
VHLITRQSSDWLVRTMMRRGQSLEVFWQYELDRRILEEEGSIDDNTLVGGGIGLGVTTA